MEAGEEELASEISAYQEVLKETRRGGDVSSVQLLEEQETLVIQVQGMLTGDEVDGLLVDLRDAAEALNVAEEDADEGEPEGDDGESEEPGIDEKPDE